MGTHTRKKLTNIHEGGREIKGEKETWRKYPI
jgi:hypothetical protein